MTRFSTTSAMAFSAAVLIADLQEGISIDDIRFAEAMTELDGPSGNFCLSRTFFCQFVLVSQERQ